MLSSQDNLDGGPRSPSASLQSPPSDHSTFSPTLSEVHAHLIRSPPPISWPMQAHERRYYPVSPRSTGTFSPDSSDGLELVNPLTVRETASRRQSHTFFFIYFPNRVLTSMFTSWMARLGFFPTPMPRLGIKLTSVELHQTGYFEGRLTD